MNRNNHGSWKCKEKHLRFPSPFCLFANFMPSCWAQGAFQVLPSWLYWRRRQIGRLRTLLESSRVTPRLDGNWNRWASSTRRDINPAVRWLVAKTTHSKSTDLKITVSQTTRWSPALNTRRQGRRPLGDTLLLWSQTASSTETQAFRHLDV